ncbi:hypothetical protein GX51_04480 [Blastomyces parvus]|uniref:Uncharacterized protein n=1 Tax=Blastomyces parvus TaxID=2060905 RepID=A0A2B7X120_9EURO|nr:hypothetical protein GX51_04480 [Blastomyces parvus]
MASRGANNILNTKFTVRTTAQGIASYNNSKHPRLRPLKLHLPYISIGYTPKNTPTARAKRFFDDALVNLYALRPRITYMWATREKGQLWWSVLPASDVAAERSVVRSWCARRMRNAFRDALRERGYDKTGRRIPDIEQREQQKPQQSRQAALPLSRLEALEGTLEIHFRLAVKTAKYTDIVREAGDVVERIESHLQRARGKEGDAKKPSNARRRPGTDGVPT